MHNFFPPSHFDVLCLLECFPFWIVQLQTNRELSCFLCNYSLWYATPFVTVDSYWNLYLCRYFFQKWKLQDDSIIFPQHWLHFIFLSSIYLKWKVIAYISANILLQSETVQFIRKIVWYETLVFYMKVC